MTGSVLTQVPEELKYFFKPYTPWIISSGHGFGGKWSDMVSSWLSFMQTPIITRQLFYRNPQASNRPFISLSNHTV